MKCFMRWESLQLMIVCRPTLTLSNNPSRGFCGYQTDLRSLISDVVKYNYVRAIAEKRQWSNTVNSRRNNDFRSRAKLILLEWKYRVLPNALSPNAVKIKLPATNVLQAIVPRWKDTQDLTWEQLVWRKLRILPQISEVRMYSAMVCWEKWHNRVELYKATSRIFFWERNIIYIFKCTVF